MNIPYNKSDRLLEVINARETKNNKIVLNMRLTNIGKPNVLKKLGISNVQLQAMTPMQLKQRIAQIPNVPMDALDRFIKPWSMDVDGNLGMSADAFEEDERNIIAILLALPHSLQDPPLRDPLSAAAAAPQSQPMSVGRATMVQMDEPSSLCFYFHDPMSTSFVRTIPRTQYEMSTLFCLTPGGLVHDLTMGVDFVITEPNHLTLNSAHLKRVGFRLTHESRDHPKMTLSFSNFVCNLSFIGDATESLHLYVPPNRPDVVIPIYYHSDYAEVQLPRVPSSHLHAGISIDPNEMIAQFAEDIRNVHLHANLQLPECPMEQLVSARVNFEHLTEPICTFLDNLFMSTASMEDHVLEKYATKIPYIYSIDMRTMACTRTQMLRHDLGIPLVTPSEFAHYNAITTTPDGLNLEQHLIRYTIFQMMLGYRKFTWTDFAQCPIHHMTFDLYLRRGAGEIGYHYDLTPGNIVSSVGLLYSMPHGHLKMGPQLIPRRYRTDRIISDPNVTPMAAFIMRNSVTLLNNATFSHTTPDLPNFVARLPYEAPYEVRNQQHEIIFSAFLNVTHDPIVFPERIRAKLIESSVNPARTFLRSWHIVDFSQAQRANLGMTEPVEFSKRMPFSEMARITLGECLEWLRTSGCMCIEVARDPVTGEIIPPSKLPGHLRGGRIMPDAPQLHFGSPKTHSKQSNQSKQSKAQSKTQSHHRPKMTSPIRASTVSHLKQQIGSKLKKLRAVLENPKKNFVVMTGRMLHNQRRHTRSHSHSQNAPNKRSYTRKVRSAI